MLRKRFLIVTGIILALVLIGACASQSASNTVIAPQGDYFQPQQGEMLAATPGPQGGDANRAVVADGTFSQTVQQAQEPPQAPDGQDQSGMKRIVLK
jgi:hypothetical protein